MERKTHVRIGAVALALVLLVGPLLVVFGQSTSDYWFFNKNVKPSKMEMISYTNDNGVPTLFVYRLIDWQTGKVVYIGCTRTMDGVASIAVTDLNHRNMP
jgi:hypothetical protein